MILFRFTGRNRLLGTDFCDRARLLYKNNARGVGTDPYYELITVIDTGKGQPITSTENQWYEDVPLVVPMKYIQDNLV